MNTNNEVGAKVYSFRDYKLAKNPNYIKKGDRIEWLDFDNSVNIGVVVGIAYSNPFAKKPRFSEEAFISVIPFDKSNFCIHLEHGMQISGSCFLRKVSGKKLNQRLPGHRFN